MIKRRLLMVAAALAVGTTVAGAQERLGPPIARAGILPAYEIVTILRSTGFDPVGQPVKRGSRYEVKAVDPDDFEVRLLVDGRTGRILTVRDSEEYAWSMGSPPHQPYGYRRAAGRFGPLSYGPIYPGGLVPPRGIPARRPSAKLDDPHKAPVPRPRPEGGHKPAVASNSPTAPSVPNRAARPSTGTPAKTASVARAPNPPSLGNTVPGAANVGIQGSVGAISGKKAKTTSTAANIPAPGTTAKKLAPSGPPAPDAAAPAKNDSTIKVVPVAPLE